MVIGELVCLNVAVINQAAKASGPRGCYKETALNHVFRHDSTSSFGQFINNILL